MKTHEKIREVRKRLGISQTDFAASLGVTAANMNGIEKGRTNPSNTLIRSISILYHIPEDWLKDEENEDFSIISSDNLYYAGVMDRFLRLEQPYREFVDRQLDELLKLQEMERKMRGGDDDGEGISCS